MRLLVGLGNPGDQYSKSRHNVGFLVLDAVAKSLETPDWKAFKGGELAKIQDGLLFKPTQFMNNSGQPIANLKGYYNLSDQDICIVMDDVYLAPGTARLRSEGGDGGHNGLKSVIERLGSGQFERVRVGVGIYDQKSEIHVSQPDLEAYVLQPIPKSDKDKVNHLIDKLVPKLIEWLLGANLEDCTINY